MANNITQETQISPSKLLLLGIQHVLAMFGATVLVPALTGLNLGCCFVHSWSRYNYFPSGHWTQSPEAFWVPALHSFLLLSW